MKYRWHLQAVDFAARLQAHKAKNPDFKKFECFCILDLEGLTMSQLNSKTLAIIKEQAAIDSLCFPETMNKMFVVNAPRIFMTTWKMIKSWLDPRTASKVSVLSGRKVWIPKLLEHVDEDQLPSDYGGKGPDTRLTLKQNNMKHLKRAKSEILQFR